MVLARSQRRRALALDGAVDDPMKLEQAGWCALFPSDADPAIKEALKPLLDWRRDQVKDDWFFKVFEGPDGVRPGQTAQAWAATRGVSLAAPVSPRKGVPYYLLIVGPPGRIPFEFQAQFDLQWAVGQPALRQRRRLRRLRAQARRLRKGLAPQRASGWRCGLRAIRSTSATPLLAGSVDPRVPRAG